jgi:hypothetical protein
MLIRKNLLIATATLTLLGTVATAPAQAFYLRFQSTDGRVTGNIIGQNDWQTNPYSTQYSNLSITGQGWSFSGALVWHPGMQVGNQWSISTIMGIGQVQLPMPTNFHSLPNVEPVNNMPPELPRIWPIFARNSTNPNVNLLCNSDSDCLGAFGSIALNMSFRDSGLHRLYSWVGYSGDIQVTAWNPTGTSLPTNPTPTLPINSVPEPSSALALLLLGTSWLAKNSRNPVS